MDVPNAKENSVNLYKDGNNVGGFIRNPGVKTDDIEYLMERNEFGSYTVDVTAFADIEVGFENGETSRDEGMRKMELRTERLVLRPWRESDAESLYEYAKDPSVGPIAGWAVHTSVEYSLNIIRNALSAPETYAVCLKEDNKAIGSIGLMIGESSNIDIPETEGEIGYWIGVPFWGQGLIPEAVREIIRYAFGELKLAKLWCGYFDGNIKSKRVQEKCGFTYHHTEVDKPWPHIGEARTEHITCLSREQWEMKLRL